jgi:hypothetical protein
MFLRRAMDGGYDELQHNKYFYNLLPDNKFRQFRPGFALDGALIAPNFFSARDDAKGAETR